MWCKVLEATLLSNTQLTNCGSVVTCLVRVELLVLCQTTCMTGRNCKAVTDAQLMAPLTSTRGNSSRYVFEHWGVGFVGPLEVKQGRNFLRRYCYVFTCFATRSNHLEIAYDLTTGSLLMAIRRFLAVRGHGTRIIYSDNGKDFTGASAQLKRDLKRLDDHNITNELSLCGIEWKQTPFLASHQGGIYKAIICLVCKAMASMVADRHLGTLTDEGLLTLLEEIECPLTRVGTALGDVKALASFMLLTERVCPGLFNDVFFIRQHAFILARRSISC